MTLQELQKQALQLSLSDRWRLVESLLNSIQQETRSGRPSEPGEPSLNGLDPWTQSLMGVIQLDEEDPTESYIDYLEKKYC